MNIFQKTEPQKGAIIYELKAASTALSSLLPVLTCLTKKENRYVEVKLSQACSSASLLLLAVTLWKCVRTRMWTPRDCKMDKYGDDGVSTYPLVGIGNIPLG